MTGGDRSERSAGRRTMVIPDERLPPGFVHQLSHPPLEPAIPLPAATAVLMRAGTTGLEVLLLKRHRASGFVPGAWVFPGGRVDEADSDPALFATVARLPADPAPEYWLATIREVFEETGVLLARDRRGVVCPSDGDDNELSNLREALMTERATLLDALNTLGLQPDLDALAYAAHWITPVLEPRRYDTRFFYAAVPPECEVTADDREMTDVRWLSPAFALEAFEDGLLPMVFPTVRTLEGLLDCDSPEAALAAARAQEIKPILPSIVRVPGGVGLVIDEEENRD